MRNFCEGEPVVLPSNTTQLIYKEEDLQRLNIRENYVSLRSQLYRSEERTNCALIQGAAFVVGGRAFPMLGVGGIDFLDSLAQMPEVDGIIGNGNALFVAKDFSGIYSAHNREELAKCYEYEMGHPVVNKFILEGIPMGSLIFLLRSVGTKEEYERIKAIKAPVFEQDDTFSSEPVPFNSHRWKNELRGKFLGTTRVVHCARRPTMEAKECLFDSREDVKAVVDNFQGHFALVYTKWSQLMCDAVGMENTRKLATDGLRNPTDRITPHLLRMAKSSF